MLAQIYRYRRISTPIQRQQTKWVMFAFFLAILGFIIVVSAGNILFPSGHSSPIVARLISNYVLAALFTLIPFSIVIAILRSRLWDIDAIINKTLVYGLLTVLLGAVYAGLIIGLESLAGLFSSQGAQPVVIVISTLAIATLFQPLRRRIQSIIDRRFYRRKYDAAKTLAAFSEPAQRGRPGNLERPPGRSRAGNDAAGLCLALVTVTSAPWHSSNSLESHPC